ncbi:hypothetical protein NTCA1_34900 [Novosphingobium sp. TCA1]|nr:hypothetical protein NTCA1_34900 [Novosphingobium sp. TCA1]
MKDLPVPRTPDAPTTPHDMIGGAPVFEAIANRFYDLMEQDPAYAALRAMHAEDLAPMRRSLPRFLAGWAGGPRDWFEANPGKCMMSLHRDFPIDRTTADQWAQAMTRAIADIAPKPANVAQAMTDVLTRMARNMAR